VRIAGPGDWHRDPAAGRAHEAAPPIPSERLDDPASRRRLRVQEELPHVGEGLGDLAGQGSGQARTLRLGLLAVQPVHGGLRGTATTDGFVVHFVYDAADVARA